MSLETLRKAPKNYPKKHAAKFIKHEKEFINIDIINRIVAASKDADDMIITIELQDSSARWIFARNIGFVWNALSNFIETYGDELHKKGNCLNVESLLLAEEEIFYQQQEKIAHDE